MNSRRGDHGTGSYDNERDSQHGSDSPLADSRPERRLTFYADSSGLDEGSDLNNFYTKAPSSIGIHTTT